jgi:choline transport protein
MLAICFINGTLASITSASRLMYSMARDNGIFFSSFFSKINKSLDVPVNTILACSLFNTLFGLLYLGPYVAFSAYMSSCTIFLNLSYAMPVVTLLIRGRGILAKQQYPGLPHQLGKWGLPINVVASFYVILTTVLFSFPTALPVNSDNMNYVVVVFGVFLVFISAYWVVNGKVFTGPDFDSIFGTQGPVLQAANSHVDTLPSENGEKDPANRKPILTV